MATRLFTYSIDQKVDYGPGTFKQSSNDSQSTRTPPFFLQVGPKAGLNVDIGQENILAKINPKPTQSVFNR